jgi:hypothetical protein
MSPAMQAQSAALFLLPSGPAGLVGRASAWCSSYGNTPRILDLFRLLTTNNL